MFSYLRFIKLGQRTFKVLACIFLPYLFFVFIPSFFYPTLVRLLALGIMVFTVIAYFAEKGRIEKGNERFRKSNLFFRYGEEVLNRAMAIPVHKNWQPAESGAFAFGMITRIQRVFMESFGSNPLNGNQVVTIIGATDSQRPSDSRGFLKISFTGPRGAIFTRFVTYQVLGKNVVVHLLVYMLGIPKFLDVLFYILSSPLRFWGWIYKWAINEYSIYSSIAKDIDSSFEIMDMRAYLASTDHVIADCIVDELMVYGLYAEGLAGQVYQTFNNCQFNFGDDVYGDKVEGNKNVNQGINYGNIGSAEAPTPQ